ncbi:DUF488 family protein [Pseudanabaena sp. ABRG5-3]|uniref:DUF488 domain-containing protein n=1 Tax=Pseudanabaena sp. ABRG5-3 TaxID=685565 RepID=UPI000DC73F75|nr:DUF488 domain-containing protein [Pseudanabaena sp. ABRG5-3]BBC26278.1 hypothetical protein ABRG53_4021 [Pseudanabaena sp. ABRG5-3]
MQLFTIGHSNHSARNFIELLQQHKITALADVRSRPYSRYLPHFCQAQLKKHLEDDHIRYVFLGQELGARPEDPFCYVDGKALYERIAATDLFTEGIRRILKGVKSRHRIALMCAEKDPLTCHRAILVCQHLKEYDLDIQHIKNNGELESHGDLEERLLVKHGFSQFTNNNLASQLSLFDILEPIQSISNQLNKEDCLLEAYQRQGNEIAYVEVNGEIYA